MTFDVRDMFVTGYGGQIDTQSCKIDSNGIKFTIHDNVFNNEATLSINTSDIFYRCQDRCTSSAQDVFSCPKLDVTGNGNKEFYTVNKHNVTTQGNFTVVTQDSGRNINKRWIDDPRSAANGFPFKRANVRAKNGFGSNNIPSCNGTIWNEVILNNFNEVLGIWTTNNLL